MLYHVDDYQHTNGWTTSSTFEKHLPLHICNLEQYLIVKSVIYYVYELLRAWGSE